MPSSPAGGDLWRLDGRAALAVRRRHRHTFQAVPLKCSGKVSFCRWPSRGRVPTIRTSAGPRAEVAFSVCRRHPRGSGEGYCGRPSRSPSGDGPAGTPRRGRQRTQPWHRWRTGTGPGRHPDRCHRRGSGLVAAGWSGLPRSWPEAGAQRAGQSAGCPLLAAASRRGAAAVLLIRSLPGFLSRPPCAAGLVTEPAKPAARAPASAPASRVAGRSERSVHPQSATGLPRCTVYLAAASTMLLRPGRTNRVIAHDLDCKVLRFPGRSSYQVNAWLRASYVGRVRLRWRGSGGQQIREFAPDRPALEVFSPTPVA